MAQVKLLKIGVDGIPTEFDQNNDEITLASFSTSGGGPVLSSTGLDMNNTDITDVQDLVFVDPSTGTINQTAGNLVVDNIMAKERDNLMTTAGAILFPVISDTAGQVDSLRIPRLPGAPTATPAVSGEGFMVWDSTDDRLFVYNGTAWKDLSVAEDAERLVNVYTAEVSIADRDALYISSANKVSPAQGNATPNAYLIGFARGAAPANSSVEVVSEGLLDGFSGLTPGARYYLSPTTPGAITSTLPTGTGNIIVKVGFAKSATELQIKIEDLGRRA
jgi:hypothetical protein